MFIGDFQKSDFVDRKVCWKTWKTVFHVISFEIYRIALNIPLIYADLFVLLEKG